MLQAVRDLFPFFVAFYLLDAVRYLSAAEHLLVSRLLIGTRMRRAGVRLGALLPGDREFAAASQSIPVTDEGVYVPRTAEAAGTAAYDVGNFEFLRYAEITSVEVEHHTLVINRGLRLKLPSGAHGRTLLARLVEIGRLAADERRERLEHLEGHALDLEAVRERRQDAERAVGLLTWLCWLHFCGLFFALPAVAYFGRAASWIGAVLLSLVVVHVAVLLAAALATRHIRKGGILCTWGAWWMALLFPPSAIRMPAALLRSVFHDFDHLAVAAALLPREDFLPLAARELHCARFAAGAETQEYWRDYWQRRLEGLERLLEMAGSSTREALTPPVPLDAEAASYCPLCGGEYRQLVASCDSCAIQLEAFEARS